MTAWLPPTFLRRHPSPELLSVIRLVSIQSGRPLANHLEGLRVQSLRGPHHHGEAYAFADHLLDKEVNGLLVRVVASDVHEPIAQSVATLNEGLPFLVPPRLSPAEESPLVKSTTER